MHEFFPIVAGIMSALLVQPLPSTKLRLVVLVLLSIVFGTMATIISGEISLSFVFLAIDTALVLLAAGVTALLIAWLRRRQTPLQ